MKKAFLALAAFLVIAVGCNKPESIDPQSATYRTAPNGNGELGEDLGIAPLDNSVIGPEECCMMQIRFRPNCNKEEFGFCLGGADLESSIAISNDPGIFCGVARDKTEGGEFVQTFCARPGVTYHLSIYPDEWGTDCSPMTYSIGGIPSDDYILSPESFYQEGVWNEKGLLEINFRIEPHQLPCNR